MDQGFAREHIFFRMQKNAELSHACAYQTTFFTLAKGIVKEDKPEI